MNTKKRTLFIPLFVFSAMIGTTAFGMDSDDFLAEMEVSAVLTNKETGEVIEVPVILSEEKRVVSKGRSTDNIETIEMVYNAGITIPEEEGVMPADTLEGSGDDGTYSYIGSISLVYDRYYDSTEQDTALLLKTFTASWVQKDTAVSISDQTYSFACSNAGKASKQKINDKSFSGTINKSTGYTVPIYESEMTSVCGGEIHGNFKRASTTWSGEVLCYVVNR